jgi:hypothetical protein
MGPAFQTLATHFSILTLRTYVLFTQETELPVFKGSMLHGWLGHSLKAVDEHAYFVLYGNHNEQQPKPYLIRPNGDLKTQWRKGEIYYFDISLFGDAVNLADKIIDACQYGEKLGLGPKRTHVQLISIGSVLPNKVASGIHACTLLDWLKDDAEQNLRTEIAIHYETPIRLKSAGKIVKSQAPKLEEWLNHIVRRWIKLSEFWVMDNKELFKNLYQEIPVMGDYETSAHIYFEDWQRYSHKEKSILPFGGLKGQVSYFGEVGLAKPWLMVGQRLHIGGKTTFGLGNYSLIY